MLSVVSPNIATYDRRTDFTIRHRREDRLGLRHAVLGEFVRPPYSYFEEAFPAWSLKALSEDMIWYIRENEETALGKQAKYQGDLYAYFRTA